MPARTARLPKYRHYKPKNLAVVRLDGRDVYLGRYDSAESREKYRRVLAEWIAGTPPAPPLGSPSSAPTAAAPAPTVNDVLLAFRTFAEGSYRRPDGTPAPELDSLRLALRPVRALYGRTPAADFGPTALKAIRQAMIDEKLCRITINQRVKRIVRVFGWAVEAEMIPATNHHALKAVRGLAKGRGGAKEGRKVHPVADALVDAVRPYVTRQVWGLIEFQRLTGCRSGEACQLRTRPRHQRPHLDVHPARAQGRHPRPRADDLHRPEGARRVASVVAPRCPGRLPLLAPRGEV